MAGMPPALVLLLSTEISISLTIQNPMQLLLMTDSSFASNSRGVKFNQNVLKLEHS
jgi:hypothetical protein